MAGPTTASERLTLCGGCARAVPGDARFCPSCGAAVKSVARQAEASAVDPLLGQVIADRYRIVAPLGRGGMGVVYRVEHVHIGKLMAIKLLSAELARDPTTLRRFEREAKVISKLNHPNTVQIFDFGRSDKLVYLVMEYLPGRDLASLLESERALPFVRVARIAVQVAASVEQAHQSGVIHRDIKPENVMILDTSEQQDFVKVLDFGIAKLRDATEDGGMFTQKGHLIGTPYYMAPEQIRGEGADHRVDIYSLGALMYKAITGEPPFTGASPLEILTQHLDAPLPPLRTRAPTLQIPDDAERIIARAMAKDPAQRYPSMAALRDDLLGCLRSLGLASGELKLERVPTLAPGAEVATRGDVDFYESHLTRANRLGKGMAALALVGLLGGAFVAWRRDAETPAASAEVEPNDEPASANALVPGRPLEALIGKRRSPGEGDDDVYRIELHGTTARVADLSVSALPNIDLALELVEQGQAQPVLTVNGGSTGQPERIPNVTLRADTYFVRVREVLAPGQLAIENVSDRYTIALSLTPESASREREPNDTIELATPLALHTPLSGLIGWSEDHDVYCAKPSRDEQTVVLSAVPRLDLVLTYLERQSEAGQRIDHHGPGAGERIALPAATSERVSCFTVSAKEHPGAVLADPTHPYEITLGADR